MTLALDPGAEAHAASEGGDETGPLLEAVLAASRANAEALGSSKLQDLARKLSALAIDSDRWALVGASTVGEQLVGAMVVTEPRLAVWTPADPRPVLIVDGWVAGTAGLSLFAHRLESLGAIDPRSVVLGISASLPTPDAGPGITVLDG